MVDLEIFLGTDQPANCPICGNRTEILYEAEGIQRHKCISEECTFQFNLEFDKEA